MYLSKPIFLQQTISSATHVSSRLIKFVTNFIYELHFIRPTYTSLNVKIIPDCRGFPVKCFVEKKKQLKLSTYNNLYKLPYKHQDFVYTNKFPSLRNCPQLFKVIHFLFLQLFRVISIIFDTNNYKEKMIIRKKNEKNDD